MKISYSCIECTEEGILKDKDKTCPYIPSYDPSDYINIELCQWPFLEIECTEGHKHRFTIGLELYELLFQQATYCIMDGYYREAIATYNSALERFLEYAIEIMSIIANNNLDFEKLWRGVSRQSERQLGAYYFLYATQMNELPIFLDENKVKLRNGVIHKGELASKEEALDFGEYVFEYIRKTNKKLIEKYNEELWLAKAARLLRLCKDDFKKAENNPIKKTVDNQELYEGIGSMYIPCFLNMDSVTKYEDCFDEKNYLDYGLIK